MSAKYDVIKAIGEGSFGKALLVRDKQNGQKFVMKEIKTQKMSAKEKRETKREVDLLARLKHPYIVSYVESFEEKGCLYIIMEYCEGGDLHQKIQARKGSLFSEEQALDWFVQLSLAMKHCHDRKILHRDIKSSNIFLHKDGSIKLGDFGIARVLSNTMELARTCIGTPYYLSPEICENRPYNNKSDIWAMGCVLYELCTLKHAFDAGNVRSLAVKIINGKYPPISARYSQHMRNLVAAMFKKSPRDRPAVNTILKMAFLSSRVEKWLTPDLYNEEFAHTILHKENIMQRPASAPQSNRQTPDQKKPQESQKQSVDKPRSSSAMPAPVRRTPAYGARKAPAPVPRYDPASVYGKPLVRRQLPSSNVRKSNESLAAMKRLEDKKKALEQQAEENKKLLQQHQRKREDKLKADRIAAAKKDSWKDLIGDGTGIVQKQNESVESDEKPSDRVKDEYQAYLNEIRKKRAPPQTPVRDEIGQDWPDNGAVKRVIHSPNDPVIPRKQPVMAEYGMGDRETPSPFMNYQENAKAAAQRGAAQKVLAEEASEKSRQVQDYLRQKREYELNKARGRADIFGQGVIHRHAPPATPLSPPAPEPSTPRDAAAEARQREEVDYLEKLRQIRMQNYRDRKNLARGPSGSPAAAAALPDPVAEKRKKMEEQKRLAEARADRLRQQLEQKREHAYMMEKKRKGDRWLEQQNQKAAADEVRNLPDEPARRPMANRPVPAFNRPDFGPPSPARPVSAAVPPSVVEKLDQPVAPRPASAAVIGLTQALNAVSPQAYGSANEAEKAAREKSEILRRLNEKMLPAKESSPEVGTPQSDSKSKWSDRQLDFTFSNIPIQPNQTISPPCPPDVAPNKWATPAAGKATYSKIPIIADAEDTEGGPDSDSQAANAESSQSRSAWGNKPNITFSKLPLALDPNVAPESPDSSPAPPPKPAKPVWSQARMTFSKIPLMPDATFEDLSTLVGAPAERTSKGTVSAGTVARIQGEDEKTSAPEQPILAPPVPENPSHLKTQAVQKEMVIESIEEEPATPQEVASPNEETHVQVEESQVETPKNEKQDIPNLNATISPFLVTGLLAGLFDTRQCNLLRTCSEPDLTQPEWKGDTHVRSSLDDLAVIYSDSDDDQQKVDDPSKENEGAPVGKCNKKNFHTAIDPMKCNIEAAYKADENGNNEADAKPEDEIADYSSEENESCSDSEDFQSMRDSLAEWLERPSDKESSKASESSRPESAMTEKNDSSAQSPEPSVSKSLEGGDTNDEEDDTDNPPINEEWVSDEGSIADDEEDDEGGSKAGPYEMSLIEELEEERMELEDLVGDDQLDEVYIQVKNLYMDEKDAEKLSQKAEDLLDVSEKQYARRIAQLVISDFAAMK